MEQLGDRDPPVVPGQEVDGEEDIGDGRAVGEVLSALVLWNLVGPVYDTVQQSYRMALTPERLQGRVTSVFRMFAQGMGPFGLALTGVLLDRVGGAVTALACGSLMALLALMTTRTPHVRAAPPLASARE